MNKGNINAVLFDAVGTLFDTRLPIGEIYEAVAKGYGSVATAESIGEAFLDQWSLIEPPRDKDSWKAMVLSIFKDVGMVDKFDNFFEELYEVFQTSGGWHCFPETKEVLQSLQVAGYRLGVVSNFDDRITQVLRALKLESFFDSVTTPYSCGYAKPDPRIFEAALNSLQIDAGDALFVGDQVVEDVHAAEHAGLNALLILRVRQRVPSDINTVSNLSEVLVTLNISTSSA